MPEPSAQVVRRMRQLADTFRVPAGKKVRLKHYDPAWRGTAEMRKLSKSDLKADAEEVLRESVEQLASAQELLYATDTYSVLFVIQGMDAAGKDGTIKHVMSGLNPQGCQVYSFKQPSTEELDHNFLWRYMKSLPERGRIGVFNRSYYEDVLVVRVHPELLKHGKLPPGKHGRAFWAERYEDINHFERHLVRNGTRIVKVFLHLSKAEQKRRFLERLEDSSKHWKFSAADLAERAFWSDYEGAFEDMLSATSTDWAPWFIVPADHKFVTRAVVSRILVYAIRSLGLEIPPPTAEEKKALAAAKRRLLAE